jgi:hypothetical protein
MREIGIGLFIRSLNMQQPGQMTSAGRLANPSNPTIRYSASLSKHRNPNNTTPFCSFKVSNRKTQHKTAKMTTPTAARHIVNFITGNANKLGEVKAILEPAIQVESQTLDLIEIQGTLEEVTLDKCRRAADLVELPREKKPNN